MNLGSQKKLAARALGISKKRIKFVPNSEEDRTQLKELISREGVKDLVNEGIIKKLPKTGISRSSANKILSQKKKGRQSGAGSRKGTANARFKEKDKWMIKIRALRKQLKQFKDEGKLDTKSYRNLYRKSKGNFFRNKRHMLLYINQNNLLNEVEKNEK